MIFVTIGTQAPFDRLIKSMDEIALSLKGIKVIAQVSQTKYPIQHMTHLGLLAPLDFDAHFSRASLIVSHAGMGTIISALQNHKPIIIFPRSANLGEHRNDHQLATAKVLDDMKYIHVAYNEKELKEKILAFISGDLKSLHTIGDIASPQLIGSIKDYIKGDN